MDVGGLVDVLVEGACEVAAGLQSQQDGSTEVVAAWSRAVIFLACQASTRVSFSPAVSKTAG